MINFKELPFYIQFTFKLLMILLLGVFLIYGQNIIIPLIFAILLSILLLPATNFLQHKLFFSRSLANLTSIVFSLAIIGGLIYFLSNQIASFLKDIPSIKEHLENHYATLQNWLQQKFHISTKQQSELIDTATEKVKNSGSSALGQTVFTITHTIFYIIMTAIYSFLILYYRHMIKRFLVAVFNKAEEPQVAEVLIASKSIVQSYIMGLLIEMGIVACACTGVLILIGVKYAIFLGIFAAILNVIPYVGIICGIIFTSLITLTTSTHLSDIVWIIVSFEVIHFIDANFLMPRIVGSKVKINALVTILGVVIGGTLIGLSGIFLALPTIAILKIIFDRIEDLKPWGTMMGDDTREPGKKHKIIRHIEKLSKSKKKTIVTTTT